MNARGGRPLRFRWRLTIAFILSAAISAGVLAYGSYWLARRDAISSFDSRSTEKARLAMSLVDARVSSVVSPDELPGLIEIFSRRAVMDLVVVTGERTFSSNPELTQEDIPEDLLDRPEVDGFQRTTVEVEGVPYLILHPVEEPMLARFFFLFSLENVVDRADRLGGILIRLWLVLAALAAVAGQLLARRTLRPVAEASAAAAALASGSLETRLPAGRDDEFGSWAASFNTMADALQDKIDALVETAEREKRFTSDVAHELRTPLSALVTSAGLLRDHVEELDEGSRWAAERVFDEVARLRKLVEELLEISRLEAGRESLDLRAVRLDDAVSKILTRRGWAGHVEQRLEPVSLVTDMRRLDRVIGNLVENAFEHGGVPVRVEGAQEDGQVVIEVIDHGRGIAEDHLLNVFDRFFKGDPARGGGSGLGLSIARENARLLGGDLSVVSRGEGSTFTVRIPCDPHDGDTPVTSR